MFIFGRIQVRRRKLFWISVVHRLQKSEGQETLDLIYGGLKY